MYHLMRPAAIIVLILSAISIILFWSPIPIVIGNDIILGGYPWVAPSESAKQTMIIIGAILTIFFIAASIVVIYISREIEGLEAYSEIKEEIEEEDTYREEELEW